MQDARAFSLLTRIADTADTICRGALAATALAMCLTVALQVFSRYVLNASLFWSEELVRMLLTWLTFLGAASAYKAKAHVGIDAFVSFLSPHLQRLLRILVLVLSAVFFLAMLVYGARYCLFSMSLSTTTLGVSKSVPFIMLPVGGALMLLHSLVFLLHELRSPRS
jgi:TRAP-type C4-dicarboxylate transport system permease small subunit